MNKNIINIYFDIMCIAQKYHNANMLGRKIADIEIKQDAELLKQYTQDIINEIGDTDE